MGLGGFSSHDASFGFFDSPAIEAVSIAFMLIAGCNFATHYVVLSRRSLRPTRPIRRPGLVPAGDHRQCHRYRHLPRCA
jgi:Trk-type K+ transport system membrane component